MLAARSSSLSSPPSLLYPSFLPPSPTSSPSPSVPSGRVSCSLITPRPAGHVYTPPPVTNIPLHSMTYTYVFFLLLFCFSLLPVLSPSTLPFSLSPGAVCGSRTPESPTSGMEAGGPLPPFHPKYSPQPLHMQSPSLPPHTPTFPRPQGTAWLLSFVSGHSCTPTRSHTHKYTHSHPDLSFTHVLTYFSFTGGADNHVIQLLSA